jgi:N-acetyl-anhydromuramyl-L-alanine amidase AmpD
MRILAAQSPNFQPKEIQPEFLVLHYTACSLERALAIFADRDRKVCAHFVLDADGTLYDLGGFWDGPILQGAHAGESYFQLGNQRFERLNLCSIGIEIVNLNGNIFPYPGAQYEALDGIIRHLSSRFPQLSDPNRIVGHEQIAGFRGKVDPGREFDWQRLFHSVFGQRTFPIRESVLKKEDADRLKAEVSKTDLAHRSPEFWSTLSAALEQKYKR